MWIYRHGCIKSLTVLSRTIMSSRVIELLGFSIQPAWIWTWRVDLGFFKSCRPRIIMSTMLMHLQLYRYKKWKKYHFLFIIVSSIKYYLLVIKYTFINQILFYFMFLYFSFLFFIHIFFSRFTSSEKFLLFFLILTFFKFRRKFNNDSSLSEI